MTTPFSLNELLMLQIVSLQLEFLTTSLILDELFANTDLVARN